MGEFRHDDCPLTLGLPRLTMEEAAARGAKTLVLGIAHAGGAMAPTMIEDAHAALAAGLNVASGLHNRLRDVPSLLTLAKSRERGLMEVRDPPKNLSVGNGDFRAGRRL